MGKTKKYLCSLFALMFIGAAATGYTLAIEGNAQTAGWNEVQIAETYSIGDVLTIPERTYGDEKGVAVMTYPDGSIKRVSGNVTLDMYGDYTISYTAASDGLVYEDKISFHVSKGAYLFSGSGSSAYYGEYYSDEKISRKGLVVNLAQGETMTFQTAIDLTGVTSLDSLVKGFVYPNSAVSGTYELGTLWFTLTDVTDPSVSLTFKGVASKDGINYPYTYWQVAGNGQTLCGYEAVQSVLHVNNEWGTPAYHSFYGSYGTKKVIPGDVQFEISYDSVQLQAFANKTNLVADMDDSAFFKTSWKGFPSNLVNLSIRGDNYTATNARIVLTSAYGLDLSQELFEDTTAPDISVDIDGEMPDAKLGVAYPIPSATAEDFYTGECKVKTSVYYNGNTILPEGVPVIDGAFVPTKTGKYMIVYEAWDYLGNKARVNKIVEVKENVPTITLQLSDEIITEAYAGNVVDIPMPIINGGTGEKKVQIEVVFGKETQVIEGTFIPESLGEYTVRYIVTDYIGQTATIEYKMTVENGAPVFANEPFLPKYYISGSRYEVPEVVVYSYETGEKKQIPVSLSITDALGQRPVTSNTFVPMVVKNGDMITLTFSAGGESFIRQVPCILSMVEEGGRPKVRMDNYMVSDNVLLERTDKNIVVSAKASNSSWTFARELLAESLSISFNAIPTKNRFSAIVITLTDWTNENIAISIKIQKKEYGSVLSIGNKSVVLDKLGFLKQSSSNAFSVTYEGGAVTIGDKGLFVETMVNGEEFTGFESPFVYMNVAFVDANAGEAAYELVNINSQPMTNAASDRVAPKMVILGDYGGSYDKGETITLPRAVATDVLDPDVSFTLTVKKPDGSIATDVNGVKLENVDPTKTYELKLDMYGQYSVRYVAKDVTWENETKMNYAVYAEDSEGPTIKFKSKMVSEAKVGDKVVIPEIVISDNVSAVENIYVQYFVMTSGGKMVELTDGIRRFEPTTAGKYQVFVMAVDEAGNITSLKHTVVVTL